MGYYSEEARKKADELAAEMEACEIKESEVGREEMESDKRETVAGDDKEVETSGGPDEDEALTSMEKIGAVVGEDPIITVDNPRGNRKRKKRLKN